MTLDKQDKPLLSWRVKILPMLTSRALHDEFHLDEPWDSEHNKTLIQRMPTIYMSPGSEELSKQGKTRYLVPVGEGCLFDEEEGPRLQDVSDGTSNTIMAVEADSDHAVIWTKPDDLEIDMDEPLDGLAESRFGGFCVLMCDGAVRFVSNNIDPDLFLCLLTRAGGEVIGDF